MLTQHRARAPLPRQFHSGSYIENRLHWSAGSPNALSKLNSLNLCSRDSRCAKFASNTPNCAHSGHVYHHYAHGELFKSPRSSGIFRPLTPAD